MAQDFGDGRWVNGRKPHRCAGCCSVIPKGEVHFQFKGKWEDEWQNWRLHAECHADWDANGESEVSNDMPTPPRIVALMERDTA